MWESRIPRIVPRARMTTTMTIKRVHCSVPNVKVQIFFTERLLQCTPQSRSKYGDYVVIHVVVYFLDLLALIAGVSFALGLCSLRSHCLCLDHDFTLEDG